MSFLNPTPLPVTLYSSSDAEAPQLGANDWTGAIKTILKACLVTGYGSKQGMGWAMTGESDNNATFTPTDPAARNVGIYVQSEADATKIDLVWLNKRQRIDNTVNRGKINRISYLSGQYAWRVVATSRGFALLIAGKSDGRDVTTLLYCGQSSTNLVDVRGQDFVLLNTQDDTTGYEMSSLHRNINTVTLCAATTGALSERPNTRDVNNAMITCAVHGGAATHRLGKYASVDMGAHCAGHIYLHVDNVGLVGLIPGVLVKSHRLLSDTNFGVVTVDGAAGQHLYVDLEGAVYSSDYEGLGLLINTETWVY